MIHDGHELMIPIQKFVKKQQIFYITIIATIIFPIIILQKDSEIIKYHISMIHKWF